MPRSLTGFIYHVRDGEWYSHPGHGYLTCAVCAHPYKSTLSGCIRKHYAFGTADKVPCRGSHELPRDVLGPFPTRVQALAAIGERTQETLGEATRA